jgi:hypothetical protein
MQKEEQKQLRYLEVAVLGVVLLTDWSLTI